MARVLVEHTSTQLFKTMEQAQETLNWIQDNLKKGVDTAPHPNKIVPVEQFEELKAKGSLPMLFDNQKLVVIE